MKNIKMFFTRLTVPLSKKVSFIFFNESPLTLICVCVCVYVCVCMSGGKEGWFYPVGFPLITQKW